MTPPAASTAQDAGSPRRTDTELLQKVMASHPEQTAEVVAALSWSVTGPEELVEFLQRTVDLAVSVLQGADSAGITASLGGEPFTAVHTDGRTLEVDAHQYEAGDGPCLHAMRTATTVLVDVADSRERWPEFTTDAERAGIHSFLAAPVGESTSGPTPRSGGAATGALNLYSTSADGFDEEDAALLQVLVGHASRSLDDYARLRSSTDLATQLRTALTTRAPIEQAKGILMAVHGITAEQAFERLRGQSQNSNVKLAVVAEQFVAAHSAPSA